jgi:hypothetical protein
MTVGLIVGTRDGLQVGVKLGVFVVGNVDGVRDGD